MEDFSSLFRKFCETRDSKVEKEIINIAKNRKVSLLAKIQFHELIVQVKNLLNSNDCKIVSELFLLLQEICDEAVTETADILQIIDQTYTNNSRACQRFHKIYTEDCKPCEIIQNAAQYLSNQVLVKLVCSHCKKIPNFYVFQPCHHVLCKFCWIRIKSDVTKLKLSSYSCPIDKEYMSKSKLDELKDADFKELKLICPPKEEKVKLQENESHSDKNLQAGTQVKIDRVQQTAVPPSTPAVSDALECTICLDPAASPINQCENGHIVCGFCADKMDQCGLCKTKLQVSVLAERQSRQFDLKCNCLNFESGCVAPLAATEAMDHVTYYRDVVCESIQNQECHKARIPLKNFPAHLQTNHDIKEILDGQNTTFEFEFLTHGDNFAFIQDPGVNWIYKIFRKHSQIFLFHTYFGPKSFHFWVTVLGDDKTAEKHWFYLNIKNGDGNPRKMEQSYTMPVLPYHGYSTFDKENMAEKCVSITPSVVTQFGEQKETDEQTKKFVLRVMIGIV